MNENQFNNSVFLMPFFKELNTQKIKYCVLRNYQSLPLSLNGSDLDIFVDKLDIPKFYEILESIGGKSIINYGELTPRRCLIGNKSGSWFALQLDVHEGILPYKTASMFPEKLLLSRAFEHNNIMVANDNDSNIIAFFKELINNKYVKKQYFNYAKTSWNESKELYQNELAKIYSPTFIKQLSAILDQEYDTKTIINLANEARNNLTKGLVKKTQNFGFNLRKIKRFFQPPGYTIAFLGTDGAGKTTIINAIEKVLLEATHNALYYEHLRPNFLPSLNELMGGEKIDGPVKSPHEKKPSNLVMSLIRLFYYAIDYSIGYWVKVYPNKVRKSSIWIFDRYFYDNLIDPKRARLKLPNSIIKFSQIFMPEPDLIICLGAEPAVIHNRKPELTIEEVSLQVKKLKKICNDKNHAYWIDTGKNIEDSVDNVLERISKNMSERY